MIAHENQSAVMPSEKAARTAISDKTKRTLLAVAAGVLLAGFWNFKFVDGLGRDVFARPLVGDTTHMTGQTGGFGFLLAMAAGLAASFTACNCVVYAMLPGLACAADSRAERRGAAWRALGIFTLAVVTVCALYGLYVGALGPDAVTQFNSRPARLHQAQVVFTGIGLVMLAWGLLEMGWGLTRLRARLDAPAVKAALMGILVGLFAVGRPFPVFRDFLRYAAETHSPLYAAATMAVQGVGQIALMLVLFALLVGLFGRRLAAWTAARPDGPARLSAFALTSGGAYFVFYWGLAFALDIGRWGFKLGWYH